MQQGSEVEKLTTGVPLRPNVRAKIAINDGSL